MELVTRYTDVWEQRQNLDNSVIRFIDSAAVNATTSIVLILNGFFILLEQTKRSGDNYNDAYWITLEILFAVMWTSEFVLKIAGYKCYYWLDAWNWFEFVLLALGWIGIGMEFAAEGG